MRWPIGASGSGFRALFYGSLISNTGDGIRLAALPLLAASLTSSPVLVSAVTAAQYLPWVSVAPLGGALVDRQDRRRVILVTQSWRGLVMLVLALVVATDVVEIWHLCLVAFAITAGEILVDPSVVALVPTMVPDEQLDAANAQISSVEVVTNDVAGRPAGAAAFAIAPWLPFVLDGGSYLTSLVPFRRLPSERGAEPDGSVDDVRLAPRPSLLSDAAEGMRFLRRHPVLGPLTAATVVYYLGAATGFSLLVLLVLESAGGPAWSFGAVLACGAVGAFVGTLLGGRASRRFGTRTTLVVATCLEGVALAAMAASTSVACPRSDLVRRRTARRDADPRRPIAAAATHTESTARPGQRLRADVHARDHRGGRARQRRTGGCGRSARHVRRRGCGRDRRIDPDRTSSPREPLNSTVPRSGAVSDTHRRGRRATAEKAGRGRRRRRREARCRLPGRR